jgi:hypothetical protein
MKAQLFSLFIDIVTACLLVSASVVYFTEGEAGQLKSIWFMVSATVLIVSKKD